MLINEIVPFLIGVNPETIRAQRRGEQRFKGYVVLLNIYRLIRQTVGVVKYGNSSVLFNLSNESAPLKAVIFLVYIKGIVLRKGKVAKQYE